jgi:hypothetical protein
MICSQGALAKGTSSFPPYKKERPRKKATVRGWEERKRDRKWESLKQGREFKRTGIGSVEGEEA